jgi:proteic killer suppression protein
MIKTFTDKNTRQLYEGGSPRVFRSFQAQAERKLQLLDAATCVEFLRSPPGNRLEQLIGNRKGQFSIRINQQYRLCFNFKEGNAFDVEIVDYY